jgi:hypothetical protein
MPAISLVNPVLHTQDGGIVLEGAGISTLHFHFACMDFGFPMVVSLKNLP